MNDDILQMVALDFDGAHATCRHLNAHELLIYLYLTPTIFRCPDCGAMTTSAGEFESELVRPFFEALA